MSKLAVTEPDVQLRTTAPVQAIQRGVAILRCFSEKEPELGVTAISLHLGLHKSTVSRILATLQFEGLVSQNPETSKYRLGLGLVSLAGVALGRLDVRGLAQPYLPNLAELTGETINISVLDGNECVIIEREASPKSIQYLGWIGRRTPVHCTSSGKVFLAYSTPAQRAAILSSNLQSYTEYTIVDRRELEACLPEIRDSGSAVVHGEFEVGFCDIAAPIMNHLQEVIATVSISGPTFRMEKETLDTFIQPLCKTGAKISSQLGYHGR